MLGAKSRVLAQGLTELTLLVVLAEYRPSGAEQVEYTGKYVLTSYSSKHGAPGDVGGLI